MTFRIHYTLPDGTEDAVVLSGDTVEEIREKANYEVSKRKATNAWSEEL